MSFSIELSKKEKLGLFDPEDKRTDDAIWSTYPDLDDNFCLKFSDFTIELNFRGDLPIIYKDVIKILMNVKAEERKFFWSFLSSSFTAKWECEVIENRVFIYPRWTAVLMYDRNGNIVEAADYKSYEQVQELDKENFLQQWDRLLLEVAKDLKKVGYDENLEDFDYLSDLLKKYGE